MHKAKGSLYKLPPKWFLDSCELFVQTSCLKLHYENLQFRTHGPQHYKQWWKIHRVRNIPSSGQTICVEWANTGTWLRVPVAHSDSLSTFQWRRFCVSWLVQFLYYFCARYVRHCCLAGLRAGVLKLIPKKKCLLLWCRRPCVFVPARSHDIKTITRVGPTASLLTGHHFHFQVQTNCDRVELSHSECLRES